MIVSTSQRADRVVLHNISWQQFEDLLRDLGEHRAARIAYLEGELEIMVPLPEHEYFKETLGDAIKDIAEVLEVNYESYGSTTWKRALKEAGLEPDNCFFFQNESLVRGRLDLDLNQGDPPPDLALEIDLTSKSLNRFPIYARLGVPELWNYGQGSLSIFQLQEQGYVRVEQSQIFPQLKITALPELIAAYRPQGRLALRQAVRRWVREQISAF